MENAVTRAWRIFGAEGHRQRESFGESRFYDWSEDGNIRILEVLNADETGTNDFSIVRITRNTAAECESELNGQISDGIFENCRVGKIEEIVGDDATGVCEIDLPDDVPGMVVESMEIPERIIPDDWDI